MDIAALRTEIKNWEYAFKAKHGREPSIQDIKDQPAVAEKYKLYKRLNKAKQSAPDSAAKSRPTSILLKSRAVKTSTSTSTSNPFSPVKSKGKQRDVSPPSPSRSPSFSRANPFATPSKGKSQPRVRPQREPSPESLSPIPSIESQLRAASSKPVPEKTAASRARKRLRGEPVSPSPVKEKRMRVASQSTLAFGKHSTLNDSDDNDASGRGTRANEDDDDEPFLDDSPVKQPAGSKAYLPLFAEASALPDAVKRTFARTQSKLALSQVASSSTHPKSRALSPVSDDEDADWLRQGKIKSLTDSLKAVKVAPRISKPVANLPTRSSGATTSSTISQSSQSRVPSSEPAAPSLVPPSPPAKDLAVSKPKYIEKAKGKGKGKVATGSRKKGKSEDEEADSESPEDDIEVKVLTRKRHTHATEDAIPDEDWDPMLSNRHAGHSSPTEDVPGQVEVSLPDELKRVLAISTDDIKFRDNTEQTLVKELVYGSRVMQYDPRKGGEIWDVGEEEATDIRAAGDEDEWEGEPVPWEVGEL